MIHRLLSQPARGTVNPMTELMRLIQAHLDRYGVSRAEFARRAGTSPQTVHNWVGRLKTMPEADHLRGAAEVIEQPYLVVLDAALVDAGYRDSMVDDLATLKQRLRRAVEANPAVIDELAFAVEQLRADYAAGGGGELGQSRRVAALIAELLRRELGGDHRDDSGQQPR